jgi:D-3-phosphoglycerate dehydrogenase
VDAATRHGVVVMNTPVGNAVTTAEHALALLFAVARRIPAADATMKRGDWSKEGLLGVELAGKTLGIIGLGNVGRVVAERARGLHLEVIAHDPFVAESRAVELGVELVDLDDLLHRADAITVHAPKTADTRAIINGDNVQRLKPGVLLINAARGGMFDEQVLRAGLEDGRIGGVGIDVYDQEPPGPNALVAHPLVVATPHLGASTHEAQQRVSMEIAAQIVDFLHSGSITNAVNQPSVPQELANLHAQYLMLVERLATLLAQVEQPSIRSLEVILAGTATELTEGALANTALARFLATFLDAPVNAVNAPLLGKERGVVASERHAESGSFHDVEYATLVQLVVLDTAGHQYTAAGTLAADGSPRLVQWQGHNMDAQLEGHLLVLSNRDQPGVLGQVGTVLGNAGINVSRMQMGRDQPGGSAVSIWALDAPLPEAVLDSLGEIEQVDVVALAALI